MLNVLNNFENFNEVYDGYLRVDKNSNLYYIVRQEEGYIAWQKMDCISLCSNSVIKYDRSYDDVITGKKLLSTTEYKKLDDNFSSKNSNIILLSDLLNIKQDEEMLLSHSDIKCITCLSNRKNVKVKTFNK